MEELCSGEGESQQSITVTVCIVQLSRCAFAHGDEHFYMVAFIILGKVWVLGCRSVQGSRVCAAQVRDQDDGQKRVGCLSHDTHIHFQTLDNHSLIAAQLKLELIESLQTASCGSFFHRLSPAHPLSLRFSFSTPSAPPGPSSFLGRSANRAWNSMTSSTHRSQLLWLYCWAQRHSFKIFKDAIQFCGVIFCTPRRGLFVDYPFIPPARIPRKKCC